MPALSGGAPVTAPASSRHMWSSDMTALSSGASVTVLALSRPLE